MALYMFYHLIQAFRALAQIQSDVRCHAMRVI